MDDVGTDGVELKAFKDSKGAMKLALLETSSMRSEWCSNVLRKSSTLFPNQVCILRIRSEKGGGTTA